MKERPFVALKLNNNKYYLKVWIFNNCDEATDFFEKLILKYEPQIDEKELSIAVDGGFFENEKITLWFELTEKEY